MPTASPPLIRSATRFACGLVCWSVVLVAGSPADNLSGSWKARPARPYVLRGTEKRLLDRAEQFLADQQWDDAIEALTQLIDDENPSVVEVGENYYIGLRRYCQLLLQQLPSEPLDGYRQLVDPAAESWYRKGIEQHDVAMLQGVVDHYLCSSWGDDALMATGALELQCGHFQAARNAWLRVAANPHAEVFSAELKARMVLTWIREGDWQQAEAGLALLVADYPEVRSRLGGRDVVLGEHLTELLNSTRQLRNREKYAETSTFAANYARTNAIDIGDDVRPYELVWSKPIENGRLESFPIVAEGLVVMQTDASVNAWSLADGEPEFIATGEVLRSPIATEFQFGGPLHTLTAAQGKVYGVTAHAIGLATGRNPDQSSSVLWSLDLRREGAIAFQFKPSEPTIAFVGAPVVVDQFAYVPVQANGHTARAGIACYDLSTERLDWQRWICQANTPSNGRGTEIVNRLIAYDAGVLYASTGLGTVAAVRASDGAVLWIHKYERRSAGSGVSKISSYYRNSGPCVYHRGTVFVLPTDGGELLALDAATGAVIWKFPIESEESRLLGVNFERVVLLDGEFKSLQSNDGKLVGTSQKSSLGWPALREREQHTEMYIHLTGQREGMIHSLDVSSLSNHFDGFFTGNGNGANLVLVGDYLVAAGSSTLSVFEMQPLSDDDQASTEPAKE
ncbi:MAG: PQQ-binding-like beta-propeller repeat protein [Planctomycetota bacterium]